MNFFLSPVSRLLTILLLGAGLLVIPGQTTTAQDTPPSLVQHLRNDLHSNDAMQREHALIDIVALANCPSTCTVSLRSIDEKKLSIENETGTSAVVDLHALIPDLLAAYRSGPADGHRLLALSALVNIGDDQSLEQLLEEGAFQSKKTNRATQRSLAAFYLSKYPELTEKTLRTKKLSIQDVRRAEAVRIRRTEQMRN